MLSLESIFSSSKFADESFDRPRWWSSGSFFTTLRTVRELPADAASSVSDLTTTTSSAASGGRKLNEILWHCAETGSVEPLVTLEHLTPPGRATPITIDDYATSTDRSKVLIFTDSERVWRVNTRGSYWVLDLTAHCDPQRRLVKLGDQLRNDKGLMFATFSPDADKVAYVYENNIYIEDLGTHGLTALTTDGSPDVINGTFDWVYEEEFHMYCGYRWAPNGACISYWQLNQEDVPVVNLINNTDSMYPKVTPIHYPKAGDTNASVRIGIVSATGGETLWAQLPGDPRDDYIADMSFHGPSGQVVLQQLNRLQNTVRVLLVDPVSGKAKQVFEDKDDAWIDISHELRWLADGTKFFFLTDRNGWRQVCLVALDPASGSTHMEYLTPIGTDVVSLEGFDEDRKCAYYIASPSDPLRRYLYKVNFDGSENVRVTPTADAFLGTNSYTLSKDGKYAVHCFSSQSIPSVYSIISLPDHSMRKELAGNAKLKAMFTSLNCPPIEFFRVDVGVDEPSGSTGILDGYILKPPGLVESMTNEHSYPVLFHVYGEPAAQIARDQWGGRLGLWHRLLAQRGCVVVCIDNRGTPCPRGRAFRKSIYRQIGILATADQATAARRILESRKYLDPRRVGVWGWSGGGSMTLNLMFKSPDLYCAGVSVAPVPDMRCYDTIYQERYMGLPCDNAEGYHNGSPIWFTENLRDSQNLLIVHGTGDDNCHYGTTERLFNELIRLNKPFEMLAYPNRSHSISEGANTSRHLFEQVTRFFARSGIVSAPSSK